MITLYTIALILAGIILCSLCCYQIFFLILSCISWFFRKSPPCTYQFANRFGIIIPAHNEELLLGELIQSIKNSTYPSDLYEILVIADNCTDTTAEIAKKMGAQSFSRFDSEKRGKPHALHWLISQINLKQYDAFVIIDADTIIDPNFLAVMDDHISSGGKALQGYFGVSNPDENWLTRLSILPGILKFKMHFPGKNLLNLSCPLAGNGMCFSTEIFQKYGWNAFSLVENWEYYLMLTLQGYTVASVKEAIIYSQVTKSLQSAKSQRVRWSKGRLETLLKYWPDFFKHGILKCDIHKIDALIEILRPSYSVQIFWSIIYIVLIFIFNEFSTEFYSMFLTVACFILGSQILYFFIGLLIQKPSLKTWLALFMVPLYILWKIFVTISGMLTFRDKSWIRTKRHK